MKIYSAKQENSDMFDSTMDSISSDFDYCIDGFYKLGRMGKDGENAAIQIMQGLQDQIGQAISQIASKLG